jgi:DNA-binding transcriptional LysR family regulator
MYSQVGGVSFEQLKAFHAVARAGSFSLAARQLFRTQSAISVQVAKLESELGHKLLFRTTKSIELTDAGRLLLEKTEQVFQSISEARRELDDAEREVRGTLSLSTSDTTACYRLPQIIQSYQQQFPAVDILIHNATSLQTLTKVKDSEVDLGIATLRDTPKELESMPLFERSDVLICHPEHALANASDVFLKDMESYRCILLDPKCSSRRIIDNVCRQARVALKITMELSSIEVVKSLVKVNSGISIVPAASVEEDQRLGRLKCITINDFQSMPSFEVGIVWRRNRYLSQASKKFIEVCRSIS